MAIHAYNLLEEQRMAASIRSARARIRHVLPSPGPVEILPIDFRQTQYLIHAATDATSQWLVSNSDRRSEPDSPHTRVASNPGIAPTTPFSGPE